MTKVPSSPSVVARAAEPSFAQRLNQLSTRIALVYHLNRTFRRMRSWREPARNQRWWEASPLDPTAEDFHLSSDEDPPLIARAWQLMEALIVEMRREAETSGARFAVFALTGDPGGRQWALDVGRIQAGEGDFILWQGIRHDVDWQRPLEELRRIGARNDVPVIEPRRTYQRYRNDSHTNAAGNLAMAQDIVDFILEHPSLREALSLGNSESDSPAGR